MGDVGLRTGALKFGDDGQCEEGFLVARRNELHLVACVRRGNDQSFIRNANAGQFGVR